MLLKITLSIIGIYQRFFRGFMPNACRFEPSCSEYARQAIVKYGFFKGITRGMVRLLKCHPLSSESGYYPVK